MSKQFLIVGLGNPGSKYEYTRHNVGFLVIQYLAEKFGFKLKSGFFSKSVTAEGEFEGQKICLMMPMTMMNNSGIAVKQMIKKGYELSDVLVITDDVNLSFGQLRIKAKGSDGGHNGLKSIIYHVQSVNFARLRMGVGQPAQKGQMVDYVLEEFDKKERDQLDGFIEEAAQCSLVWIQKGIGEAMALFNRRKKDE